MDRTCSETQAWPLIHLSRSIQGVTSLFNRRSKRPRLIRACACTTSVHRGWQGGALASPFIKKYISCTILRVIELYCHQMQYTDIMQLLQVSCTIWAPNRISMYLMHAPYLIKFFAPFCNHVMLRITESWWQLMHHWHIQFLSIPWTTMMFSKSSKLISRTIF